jgi:hypothetical protein
MLPYILAAVGGYLIGDSMKGKQFAEGGSVRKELQSARAFPSYEEKKEFKEYLTDFYGKEGTWKEFFPPKGASAKEINLAILMYTNWEGCEWEGGDSIDREITRDVMLYNRGKKKGLEWQKKVNKIVSSHSEFLKSKYANGGMLEDDFRDPEFIDTEKGILKFEVKELDTDGNTIVEYDEESNNWYWEYKKVYKDGFESEEEAYRSLLGHLIGEAVNLKK